MEWTRFALLVPLVVGGGAIVVKTRLASARETWRRARVLEAIGPANSVEHVLALGRGDEATLEGVLRTDTRVVSYHPHGTSFLHEVNVYAVTQPTPPLRLELEGGGQAMIEGPVQVLVGNVESEHDAGVGEGASLGANVDIVGRRLRGRKTRGQFRVLDDGVRVRIHGRVERAPDDDAAYRALGRSLRITPRNGSEPGAETIPIAAVGTTRPHTLGRPLGNAAIALVAGILATVLAFEVPASAPIADPPILIVPNRPLSNAAFRALEAWSTGQFREASDAFAVAPDEDSAYAPSLSEVEAHLFAHDRARAAAAGRRMSERFYSGPETAERRYLGCIVDRIANGHGAGMPQKSSENPRPLCTESALAAYGAEIEVGRNMVFGFDGDKAVWELVGDPFTAVLAPRERLYGHPIGVERFLVDDMLVHPTPSWNKAPAPGDPYGKIHTFDYSSPGEHFVRVAAMTADLALFYASAEMPERTTAYWPILDRIAATLEAEKTLDTDFTSDPQTSHQRAYQQTYLMQELVSVAAAAAYYAHDDARADRYARVGDAYPVGAMRLQRRMANSGAWEDPIDLAWPGAAEILREARSGDGERVAAVLERRPREGIEALVRVLPQITKNRDALARYLRTGPSLPCRDCGAGRIEILLAERLAIARAVGAADVVTATEAPLARFVDALGDPEVAWDIAELETFFARKR